MKSIKVVLLLIVLSGILGVFLIIIYSDTLWGKQLDTETNGEIVRIWTIHGDTEEALKSVLKQYEESNPGVTFDLTVYKNEVYQTAINNAMLTDNLPDMFFMWGYSKLERFVEAGLVLDFTSLVEKNNLPEALIEGRLDAFTFDGKIYGLPLYGWTASLFCNREIFGKYKIEYPKNYEEFMDVCEELKKHGEVPVITGARESWLSSLYYMSLVQGEGPGKTIIKASEDYEQFTKSQFTNATEKMSNFVKKGIWQDNYLECDAYNAAYMFAQGKGAMLYYGSWATSLLEGETSQVNNKVDVIPFPNSNHFEGIGGYVDTFAINKKGVIAKNEDLTQMYIELMQSVSDMIVNNKGGGIPVYKNQVIEEDDFPLLYQCWKISKHRILYPAYDQIMSEELSAKYYILINELMADEISDREFINRLSSHELNN